MMVAVTLDTVERWWRRWSVAVLRWCRGRPGTGGIVVLFVVGVFFLHPYHAALGDWMARARWEWEEVAWAAVGLAAAWGAARLFRRFAPRDEADKAGRCLALPPSVRVSWWWPMVGAAAIGAVRVAWRFGRPWLAGLWAHGGPGAVNALGPATARSVSGYLLTVVVGAPLLEEVLFRGCLLSWLARRTPIGVAMVLSTVAFTMVHGIGAHSYNTVQLASVAADGFVFASLYVASGSLLPGIVAHMAVNAVSLLVPVTGLGGFSFAVLLVVVGAPGVVCLVRGYGRGRVFGRSFGMTRFVCGQSTDCGPCPNVVGPPDFSCPGDHGRLSVGSSDAGRRRSGQPGA